MPIPIFVYIAAALVGGAGGVVTVYQYRKEIKKYFTGKDIVILGESRVGKTTLHKYLRYGELVKEHIGTNRAENVKKNVYKLKGLKLKIAEGKDVPGQKDFQYEWKPLFVNGDICFYLFNSVEVSQNNNDTIKAINSSLYHIGNWKKEAEKDMRVILIGTHMDKINNIGDYNKSNIQELHKDLRKKLDIGLIDGDIKASEFFLGNLFDKEERKVLMSEILNYLATSKNEL
ncbi:GTPase domain-containing protein [Lutibacter flavus]|uniref:Ras of Complex, Roc, domain of DAPkinase n=1 Tax=Lutibacter flavus TaxID=691689 RepID=A0A238XKD4_9FLAO|nr:GTPase domain-containing protein [Lutibacter flavus]SNR58933.1 Ras of Complex, Roc, domain of DAPkinase [Lutibacter flavus]